MSRKRRWRGGLFAIALLGISGCCGGGSTHKCDFTPPDTDAGGHSDAALGCPSQPCAANQVCCVAKTPPFISCIDPADFIADGCEMFHLDNPSCSVPQDCDGGVCCAQVNLMSVTCQAAAACPGDGVETYRTCSTDRDCPIATPGSCQILPSAMAQGLSVGFCQATPPSS